MSSWDAAGRRHPRWTVWALLAGIVLQTTSIAQSPPQGAVPGLSEAVALGNAYDAVLNADFPLATARLISVCGDVPAWCQVMEAVSLWWQIALDPDNRVHDHRFSPTVERAITATEAWAEAEPLHAEAWFSVGAAYGARSQWRVARKQRLGAARDGKRIRAALERALSLDPNLHDAKFGIGMYRYYADVAPAGLRMLRWLLLLPGGNRVAGLQQMIEAYELGDVTQGEAAYQLHLIYLWYEDQAAEALTLIRELQRRYPRNPLFVLNEAHILDVYFHDERASEHLLRTLITRAESAEVNESALAKRRARALLDELHARAKH